MQHKVLLAPSLLSANLSSAGDEIQKLDKWGVKWLHIDVMDGHFVNTLTFGPPFIASLRHSSSLFFDVHLMVSNPSNLIADCVAAGSDMITIHYEAETHIHRTLELIHSHHKKAGIALLPHSHPRGLDFVLPFVDLVLVMTVNPGSSGQKMIDECLKKVGYLKQKRTEGKLSFLISIDGGVNEDNIAICKEEGADILISGSHFFNAPNPENFRKTIEEEGVII